MNFIQIPLHSPEKHILINVESIDYIREFTRPETCIISVAHEEFEVKVSYKELSEKLINLAK